MKETEINQRIHRLESHVLALFLHLKSVNNKLHELTLRYPDLVEMQIAIERELAAIESFVRVKK